MADQCYEFHTFCMIIRGSICVQKIVVLVLRKENILYLNNKCSMGSSRSNSLFVPHQFLPPKHEGTRFLHEEGSSFCLLILFLAFFGGAPTKKVIGIISAHIFPQHVFFMRKWGKDQYTSCRISTSVQMEDFDVS